MRLFETPASTPRSHHLGPIVHFALGHLWRHHSCSSVRFLFLNNPANIIPNWNDVTRTVARTFGQIPGGVRLCPPLKHGESPGQHFGPFQRSPLGAPWFADDAGDFLNRALLLSVLLGTICRRAGNTFRPNNIKCLWNINGGDGRVGWRWTGCVHLVAIWLAVNVYLNQIWEKLKFMYIQPILGLNHFCAGNRNFVGPNQLGLNNWSNWKW